MRRFDSDPRLPLSRGEKCSKSVANFPVTELEGRGAKAARVHAAAVRKAAYEQVVRADVVEDLERRGLW